MIDPRQLRLEGFQVWQYRSVRRSGFVPLHPLTCLVGRQQSGKTSLLRALAGLDPSDPRPYSAHRDAPSGAAPLPSRGQVVCAATLVNPAQPEPGRPRQRVRVARTYAGEFLVEAWSGDPDEHGTPPSRDPEHEEVPWHRDVVRALPPILFADSEGLLPGAAAGSDLVEPRRGDLENGLAALGELLLASGLEPEQLDGHLSKPDLHAAGVRLRERLGDLGLAQPLVLHLDRGRLVLQVQRGRRRLPVDQLRPGERLHLTVNLRLAAARLTCPEGSPLLLLDGPGRVFRRHLRPTMLAMLEDWVGLGFQVVYSSRLPFELTLLHPEQVLVLAPQADSLEVTRPSRDVAADLALRAALGMTGRPSFRVGDLNLMVEGPSDVWILRALDGLARRSGEPGLPAGVNLASAGGSHEVAVVTEFLGRQGLGVVALLDSDSAGRAAVEVIRADHHGDLRQGRVRALLLGEAAELRQINATIESLFPEERYLEAVRAACPGACEGPIRAALADLPADEELPPESLAYRLGRAFSRAGQPFPKAQVARRLESWLEAQPHLDKLSAPLQHSARTLLERTRSALLEVQAVVTHPTQASEASDG